MVVTITRTGYVKRLPVATYRQQKRGGKGLQGVNLKENDFVEHLFIASTHDYMLFFSTRGKCYRLKVHELPMGSRHARGTAIVNLLPFEGDEAIAAVISTKEFPQDEYLLFATREGMVKKTAMSAYDRSRRDGLIAINLRDSDALIAVRRVKQGEHVVMVSSAGKAILWDENEARPMGRDTMGVKGMTAPKDACVIGMEIASEGSELFVVTQRGYGKRTPMTEYPVHHRGGQGVFTIQMTEKKGPIVGMKIVMQGQELMLMSEEGVVIRVKSTDVSQLGRSTQGVKVMNVSDTDRVTAVARVASSTKKPAKADAEGQPSLFSEGSAGADEDVYDDDFEGDFEDDGEEMDTDEEGAAEVDASASSDAGATEDSEEEGMGDNAEEPVDDATEDDSSQLGFNL
jgi:DNA gyrase subunit A